MSKKQIETIEGAQVNSVQIKEKRGRTSIPDEWMDCKIDELDNEIKIYETYQLCHKELKRKREESMHDDDEKELDSAAVEMQKEVEQLHKERLHAKRQKRALINDMKDRTDTSYEDCYVTGLVEYVMNAKANQSSYNSGKFRDKVTAYYDAERKNPETQLKEKWCHLTGWQWQGKEGTVKAAHLVSRSLPPKTVAYLFGEDDAPCTNPKNGKSNNLSDNLEDVNMLINICM